MTLTTTQQNLVNDNMGLAGQFRSMGDEAYSDALLALCKAAATYNPDSGFKFSTYAMTVIRRDVNRGFGRNNQTPQYIGAHVDAYLNLMAQGLTDCEIREVMGATLPVNNGTGQVAFETVSTYANLEVGSLDIPDDNGKSQDVADYRGAESAIDVTAFLDCLDARQRDVIESRYGIRNGQPQTLQVIADRLGVTKERVRQIEKSAISTMQFVAK